MLWVLFNENGQNIHSVNVGSLPYAGTNDFQIFAVFEKLDVDAEGTYPNGSIKFYKPDLDNSSYLPLVIYASEQTFPGKKDEKYFQKGKKYKGLYFNFADYEGSFLIDMPGLWRAVITLYSSNASIRKVVGGVVFNVGSGIDFEDPQDSNIDELLQAFYAQLALKLNISSPKYIKVVPKLSTINEPSYVGYINSGDIVFAKEKEVEDGGGPLNAIFTISGTYPHYVGTQVEMDIDLANYYTKSETDTLLNAKVDKVTTTAEVPRAYTIETTGAQSTTEVLTTNQALDILQGD